MQTNGPLFDCVGNITLTGLSGSATESSAAFGLASNPYMISNTADWQKSGQLTLTKTDTLQGCKNIIITFDLKNPSTSNTAVNVTAGYVASLHGLDDVTSSLDLLDAATPEQKTRYVVDTSWSSASINSTSTEPCQLNTITVVIQPAIPLYCDDIEIVISGLGNFRTVRAAQQIGDVKSDIYCTGQVDPRFHTQAFQQK